MKIQSIYLLAAAFMLMAFASCKKDYLKINTDPTTVTAGNYDPNFLLTEVQLMYTGSTDFGAENWQTEWGGISGYIQHCASVSTGFYYGDKYLYSPGNTEVYFTHAYIYQVQPVVELYQLTANKPQYINLHQMSRIMKALVFERITDMYGDVPYFQAGLAYYDRIYTPVYDTQQAIYADMLKEVSQAIDSLGKGTDIATGDVFYASNDSTQINEWKKFGNSVLLRMAMRLSKVDPTTAQTYVNKVQNQTMTSVDDNAIVQHEAGSETQNRDAWSIIQEDRTDLKWCSTYIDTMKSANDPRLAIVAELFPAHNVNPAKQVGLPPGYIIGGLNPDFDITKKSWYPTNGMDGFSMPSDAVLNYTAPNFIVTYAETELLLADAASRWGITTSGDAKTHYVNALRAAQEQMSAYGVTVDETAITNYVTAQTPTGEPDLGAINLQYWLCTVFDEYETWANWRRTGFPQLKPTDYTTSNQFAGEIPRRLDYPQGQRITNGANYATAVARLPGGDAQTSRVWWDTK